MDLVPMRKREALITLRPVSGPGGDGGGGDDEEDAILGNSCLLSCSFLLVMKDDPGMP